MIEPGLSQSVLSIGIGAVDLARGIIALNHLPESLRQDRNNRVMCLVDTFLEDPLAREAIHVALAVDWRLDAAIALARIPEFTVWNLAPSREAVFDVSIGVLVTMADRPVGLVKSDAIFEVHSFLERLGMPVERVRQPIGSLTDAPREFGRVWTSLRAAWLQAEAPDRQHHHDWDQALRRLEAWCRAPDTGPVTQRQAG